MDKKRQQYEAVKAFGVALHNLRLAGVRQDYISNGPMEKIDLIDTESGQHIGQFGGLDMTDLGMSQIVDELAFSTDYFGEIAGDVSGMTGSGPWTVD